MSTAIDSNVLIALWNEDDSLNTQARSALDTALGRGGLFIAAPVFAELLAAPSRTEVFLIRSARKRLSLWIGISTRLSGAPLVAPFKNTLDAEEGTAALARAAFSPIS